MAESRNSFLSKLAAGVTSDGDISSDAIAPSVTQSLGTSVYDSASLLPIVGNTAGDTAFVKSTSRLYIHSGLGWYNVAVINNTPTVQSILDSDSGTTPFSLATDGTPTTITITAQDSDGDALTYNYSADSNFAGLATLSQDTNVFTITPLSQDSATTLSGTITFTVTDGINTATPGIQTFTLEFLSALWDETVLSIGTSSTNSLGNSTFIDRSTNALTVTTSGSPIQTAFHPYLDKWSVEFDGSSSYLESSYADLGSDDYTLEFWYRVNSANTTDTITAGAGQYGPWLFYFNGSSLTFYASANSGWDITSNQTVHTPALQTWYHIALVRDADVGYKIYVDGVQVLSINNTMNISYTSQTLYVGIGYHIGSGTNGSVLDGSVSNYRLVVGSQIYTSTFTPPTEKLTAVSGTSLLTCQSNRFIDNSTNTHAIAVNGNSKISAYNPFGQGSEYAPGENKGSYKNVTLGTDNAYVAPHTSKVLVYNEDWTIEFWCYADTFTTQSYIIGKGILTSRQWAVAVQDSILRFYYSTNGSSSGDTTKDISYDFITGQWYHIALVNDGATNTLNYYVNGTSIGTQVLGAFFATNGYGEYIGKFMNYGDANHGFNGYISDLKIDNGNKLYTSAFTPPTAPVGNTNADLYLPMDNAGIFDKTVNNTLTLVGNTSTSTTQTKFADTSVYFDGTGDYIETQEISGSNIWTIETWFRTSRYYSGSGHFDRVWSYGTTLGDSLVLNLDQTNGAPVYRVNDAIRITSSSGINTNTWYHLALVCDGTNTIMYLDGTNVGSYGSSYSLGGKVFRLATLDGTQGFLSGYIENFQILKGVAKYTTNFTPPIETQGRTYQAED